jgi:hypothetical protein
VVFFSYLAAEAMQREASEFFVIHVNNEFILSHHSLIRFF